MKILSLNTWQERGPWRDRWEVTFEGLRNIQPNITAFQEVFKADWAKEIQKRTGAASLVFFPEPSGLVLASTFKVTSSSCLTLKTQSAREDYKRYVVFAEFETPLGPLCFFNTHLSWKVEDSQVRAAQVRELIDFIKEEGGPKPCVAAGDFNAAPDTVEIRQMPAAGFTDTFEAMNPGSQELTWDNRNPWVKNASVVLPDRRIDYIFTRNFEGVADILSSKVVLNQPNENAVFASDHYGVLTELKRRR